MASHLPVVTGKPYSAEKALESDQTLADGTHIKKTMFKQKLYRDSQGRTRTEREILLPPAQVGSPLGVGTSTEIVDPVAQVRYFFNNQSKLVSRQKIPTAPLNGRTTVNTSGQSTVVPIINGGISTVPPVKNAVPSDPSQPQFTSEKLASQTIEGIAVEGQRTTVTYPAGSVGNDREIVTMGEVWMSLELGVTITSKTIDPRSGVSTQKLSNISRDEPDPSLFQPPAGYEVVDEPKR